MRKNARDWDFPREGTFLLFRKMKFAKQSSRKGFPGRGNSMGRDLGVRERIGHWRGART